MTLLSNMLRTAADCVQADEHYLANRLLVRYRELREGGLDEPRIAPGVFGDSLYRSLWGQHLENASRHATASPLGG